MYSVLAGDRPGHNMPSELTTFVGRIKDAEHLVGLLALGFRLVTLAGAGGSGKTRLAQQIGLQIVGTSPYCAWFVDLAPTNSPDLLASVVARTSSTCRRSRGRRWSKR